MALVASGGWQWWTADHYGTLRAYLGTDTRAAALFAGCLLAVLMHQIVAAAEPADPSSRTQRWSTLAVAGSVGWLGYSWAMANFDRAGLYHGWLLSCSVAGAVLIAAVVLNPSAGYTRLLATAPLVWVGKRSYSLYLWHWPIWVMMSPPTGNRPP